jgi:hypothetical protein
MDEQESQFLATWKVLFQRDLKVVFYCPRQEGAVVLHEELTQIVVPENYGKVYGEDYVRLGFNRLEEAGQAAFALDIRSVYKTDYLGTPIDDIPMMKDIHSHEDIDLMIWQHTAGETIDMGVRQWVATFNVPLIDICLSGGAPMVQPYYPTQVKGYLAGALGGTQLEIYANVPGPGVSMTDSTNLGILGMLIFVILGNASYWGKKLTQGEEQ